MPLCTHTQTHTHPHRHRHTHTHITQPFSQNLCQISVCFFFSALKDFDAK